MNSITRKSFLGSLAAAASTMAFGSLKSNDGLDDIYDDKYYVLQGGPYEDTGGVGAPGVAWRKDLLDTLRYEDHCRNLDSFIDHVESNGFYFTVSLYTQHSDDAWVAYGFKKITLTKKWLSNFYNKHNKQYMIQLGASQ